MQKQSKKEKLQKKLHKPNLQLTQLLHQQNIIEMFRNNNPHLHKFLKLKHFRQLLDYVTIIPSDQQKNRAYKYPLIACQILSSQHPKILEMMLCQVSQQDNSLILMLEMLKYFDGQPNYVLSSYIIKILTPLYFHQPVRIQHIIIQNGILRKMVNFCNSRSVSDFIIRLICVQYESLLTLHLNERKQVFNQILNIYDQNKLSQEFLTQFVHIIYEIVNKLFETKHKQLGRFSEQILKMIEIVVEKNNLYNQQMLVIVTMKHLINYCDHAPFLIKILVKNIHSQLKSLIDDQKSLYQPSKKKFGLKNNKLLQSLTYLFNYNVKIIEEILQKYNLFALIINLMIKFQWNSMAHVQIQKIFLSVIKTNKYPCFKYIVKINYQEIINETTKRTNAQRGFAGTLTNLLLFFNQNIKKQTQFGNFIKQNEKRLKVFIQQYCNKKQQIYKFDLAGYKKSIVYAKPCYDQKQVLAKHSQFLEQVNIELKQLLLKTHDSQQALNQIQDQNLVNRSWGLNTQQIILQKQ